MGALAMGVTASTLPLLTDPLYANTAAFDEVQMNDAEEWFKKIKGTHRIVYDGSTPHDGFPIIWNWAFYLTNNETGVADDDITAMTVIRHSAIPFALRDSVWEKYGLGKMVGVNDNKTGQPSTRNTVYEPQEGDFPLPIIQGINDLQGRGALFCVCNLALSVYSSMAAQQMGMDPQEAYQEWVDNVYPGI